MLSLVYRIWELLSAVNYLEFCLKRCALCVHLLQNIGCKIFMPLFYCTVDRLPFYFLSQSLDMHWSCIFFGKWHASDNVTDHRIFNWLHHIRSQSVDLFTYGHSLKVSWNLSGSCERYMEKQMYYFFLEHSVLYHYCFQILLFVIFCGFQFFPVCLWYW